MNAELLALILLATCIVGLLTLRDLWRSKRDLEYINQTMAQQIDDLRALLIEEET